MKPKRKSLKSKVFSGWLVVDPDGFPVVRLDQCLLLLATLSNKTQAHYESSGFKIVRAKLLWK